MKKIVLGIDGGGTKSHLALFDEDGICVGISMGGPLNHESMEGSFDELEATLGEFINGALAKAGAAVGDVAYAAMGIAGVDTAAQHATISAILRRLGINDFYLCNDAYLGVAAGCPGGVGICAINGTGTSLAAVDHSGNSLQIAGIGYLTDDRGGSGWYGSQVLSMVYDSLYKGAKQTILKDMIFKMLGITRKEEYIDALTTALGNGGASIENFNRLLFKAAGADDEVAIGILDYSAEHFAGSIAHMAKYMDFPNDMTLNITFAGSVFVKEKVKVLPQLIDKRVRGILGGRPLEYFTLDTVPVAGSILWAAQKAGFGFNMDVIKPALAESGII